MPFKVFVYKLKFWIIEGERNIRCYIIFKKKKFKIKKKLKKLKKTNQCTYNIDYFLNLLLSNQIRLLKFLYINYDYICGVFGLFLK